MRDSRSGTISEWCIEEYRKKKREQAKENLMTMPLPGSLSRGIQFERKALKDNEFPAAWCLHTHVWLVEKIERDEFIELTIKWHLSSNRLKVYIGIDWRDNESNGAYYRSELGTKWSDKHVNC